LLFGFIYFRAFVGWVHRISINLPIRIGIKIGAKTIAKNPTQNNLTNFISSLSPSRRLLAGSFHNLVSSHSILTLKVGAKSSKSVLSKLRVCFLGVGHFIKIPTLLRSS
jgi:hypothetical protein